MHSSPLSDAPATVPAGLPLADRPLPDIPAALPLTVRRPSSRETILDAAEAVVLADGAAHLTLDAVAERAGVSKGGLLYHFPSKEILLQAMVDRNMRRLGQDHAAALAQLPPGPGRELKAFVHMAADRKTPGLRKTPRRLPARRLRQRSPSCSTRPPLPPLAAGDDRRPPPAPGCPSSAPPSSPSPLDGLCLLEMLAAFALLADAQRHASSTTCSGSSTKPPPMPPPPDDRPTAPAP